MYNLELWDNFLIKKKKFDDFHSMLLQNLKYSCLKSHTAFAENMNLGQMESADKDQIKNCELLKELKN